MILLGVNEADIIRNLVYATISLVVVALGQWIFSFPVAYVKSVRKQAVEKEYFDYLKYKDNPSQLTNLFLDRIARGLSLIAFWIFAFFVYFAPFWHVNTQFRELCASLTTAFFCCLIVAAMAKPINLHYAMIEPEKFKKRVTQKLGALPGERQ